MGESTAGEMGGSRKAEVYLDGEACEEETLVGFLGRGEDPSHCQRKHSRDRTRARNWVLFKSVCGESRNQDGTSYWKALILYLASS